MQVIEWTEHERRVLDEGMYIVKSNATVREAAKMFKISKSTVHRDMTSKLKELNLSLYHEVRGILDYNLSQRHIRGGESNKRKHEVI